MAPQLTANLTRLGHEFAGALLVLAGCAAAFALLAFLTKGRRAIDDARAAAGETRTNLIIDAIDGLAVAPVIAVLMAAIGGAMNRYGLRLDSAGVWAWLGQWPTVLAAVALGDFFGYWRHRAQHSRWLWPAHAIHHSDTRLTWLTLVRMHPIDRLGTLTDTVLLAAVGAPPWALAVNSLVRHYWGFFIHADVPWTFGKAGWLINSPVMHRWHHARDVDGAGHNFATVLSVWDRAFGTYHQPGLCTVPLGVREDMGEGALGQYAHPLKVWAQALKPREAELSS